MCSKRKQRINYFAMAILILVIMNVISFLFSAARAQSSLPSNIGGVELGENLGGVLDKVYIAAPPSWQFVVSLKPGSFLDCGAGMAVAQTDGDGRSIYPVNCGVTLTETLIIPSASQPAQLIVHY